jgi:hypothetical protein
MTKETHALDRLCDTTKQFTFVLAANNQSLNLAELYHTMVENERVTRSARARQKVPGGKMLYTISDACSKTLALIAAGETPTALKEIEDAVEYFTGPDAWYLYHDTELDELLIVAQLMRMIEGRIRAGHIGYLRYVQRRLELLHSDLEERDLEATKCAEWGMKNHPETLSFLPSQLRPAQVSL